MLVLHMTAVLGGHSGAPLFQQPETKASKEQTLNATEQDDAEPKGSNDLIVGAIVVQIGSKAVTEIVEVRSGEFLGGIKLFPWSAILPDLPGV